MRADDSQATHQANAGTGQLKAAPAETTMASTGRLTFDDEAWVPSERERREAGRKFSGHRSKVLMELYDDPEIERIPCDAVLQATGEVRARAGAWRIGVASVFTLVLATLVISEPQSQIMSGSANALPRFLLAGLVVGAAVCGLLSLYYLLRAAHGPTSLGTKIKDLAQPVTAQRAVHRLLSTVRDFRWGQRFLGVAVLLFLTAWAWTWIDPTHGLH